MALDAAETFELRWLIAQSRRRHEMYLATIADAILLASQQVQDKRIDLLEQGPELSASEIFVDFLISIAFAGAGPVIKVALTDIISRAVAQRAKSFLAEPGKLIKAVPPKLLTPERINRALEIARKRVQRYDVPTGGEDPKNAPVEWRLFRELSKETIGLGLEKTKEALKKAPQKTAPFKEEAGGDTPGVALMDTVLSFVRQQQSAIDLSHDLDDIWVTGGVLSDATAQSLKDFYSKEKELPFRNPTGGSDFQDLSELKEKLKLFFEACIWAALFSARFWVETIERITVVQGGLIIKQPPEQYEIPADKRIQKYWFSRFQGLETFPKNGEERLRIIRFFKQLDSASDQSLKLLRHPEPKKP